MGKKLLIHYDEKWFWGLVLRRDAKACDSLGLEATAMKAYHRNHINKVMGIAFVGFAFTDCIESGGEAIKLGFFRANSYKVAERMVKDRKTNMVVRKKDDLYLVDCAVTGSNKGTSDDPKFPLLNLFEHHIFPRIETLVGPGCKYEGYKVVIQGDNAGPHNEAAYINYVTSHCNLKGYHWEPQAPQMPHLNVLDLSVFPAMSKRHTALSRERGGLHVLKQDVIWDDAKDVLNTLPICKIASADVSAFNIAGEDLKEKGGNTFLGKAGLPSFGIRKNYTETIDGLVLKSE